MHVYHTILEDMCLITAGKVVDPLLEFLEEERTQAEL
jgi:hypothetical protein